MVTIMMMMVVIEMIMMVKIKFLSVTMAIKNGRPRRQNLTYQGLGFGVSPKTKKRYRKIVA